MKKLLTIVVPTYNMESLLPRCLDSFLLKEELMSMMEVIVVNDGSKDRSSEIAHNYVLEYPNTYQVIDKLNGNYGSCINAALKIATGKYFRICDADDCYNNTNLEKYLCFLSETDADIVFSPFNTYVADDLVSTFEVPGFLHDDVYNIDDLNWRDPRISIFRAMHSMAIKREILVNNNYSQSEGISYSDTQFVFYSCLYASTCTFFKNAIYLYFLGRGGQTMSEKAIINSSLHFYINAKKMLEDYLKNEHKLSDNRAILLIGSIISCVRFFSHLVLRDLPYNKDRTQKLEELFELIGKTQRKTYIESLVSNNKSYKLWHKYHFPAMLVNMLCVKRWILNR